MKCKGNDREQSYEKTVGANKGERAGEEWGSQMGLWERAAWKKNKRQLDKLTIRKKESR